MSAADAPNESPAKEPAQAEPFVDETVVNQKISDAEEGHSGADADEARAEGTGGLAPRHDERGRDGRVQEGQAVVPLEASSPRLVVRAMDGPEASMPRVPMQKPRPGLHRRRGYERGHASDGDLVHEVLLDPCSAEVAT